MVLVERTFAPRGFDALSGRIGERADCDEQRMKEMRPKSCIGSPEVCGQSTRRADYFEAAASEESPCTGGVEKGAGASGA